MPREDDLLETAGWGTWVVMAASDMHRWRHPVCVLAGPPPTGAQVAAAVRDHSDRLPWDHAHTTSYELVEVGPTILTRALEA